MKNKKAVVLVSGGMDSCTTAAIAAENHEVAFLHLNYGQKTEKRELKAFNNIADYYGVRDRLVIDVKYFTQIGGSSLTDFNLKVEEANLERKDIPNSYVPFRNANILAIATSWAEVIGAERIFVGAVQDDSSGYPDCREEFFKAFNEVIKFGTKPETVIEIETPLLHLKKHEIVLKALEIKAPIQLSWSCYQNEEQACGVCDSCALRLRGFQQAGQDDPIPYVTKPTYI
jgi:7-cyano-7-deazaguanine synthase